MGRFLDYTSPRSGVAALRLDDPAKLAQIDAVFVTIEPHGGSERPTGKAFLYAYLKKDPNHP
jgi:hypothetical protein